jgi:hypothetical protein
VHLENPVHYYEVLLLLRIGPKPADMHGSDVMTSWFQSKAGSKEEERGSRDK